MLLHCFKKQDLDELNAWFTCLYPESDEPDDLHITWQQNASRIKAVVTGWDSPPITDQMLLAAPELEILLHSAGSVKPFIPDSIWKAGVRVVSANDALGKGVAETTLGLIIGALKGIFPCSALTRTGGWQNDIPKRGFGRVRELYDVKIGIIGASRTGRHVLRLLSHFDAEVLLFDPTISAAEANHLGARLVTLPQLLQDSDVASLHAPALPSLRHLLGAAEFSLMKDDATFINTARGMLVDEEALAMELKTGRISAIIDVTDPEPPRQSHPFRHLPNVILLPHISGALTTGCLRQGRSVIDQLLQYRRGARVSGEITAEKLAIMA